jgi:bifunctional non-homologous end joining protein LigD
MNKPLVFVIQQHDATSLHYDFRLEIGGVMPSWAIPKGPTLDNTKKRLAMKTPDHDFSYRKFEGVLPEGKYGAGPVIIWDEGEYIPEVEIGPGQRKQILDRVEGEKIMEEGLKKGEIKFELLGKKVKGSFALVKTKGFAGPNAWLLIKHKDKFIKPDYDAKDYPKSVVSGKTVEEMGK